MFTLQDAMKLAINAFGDQKDKSGRELSVWHSFRVAEMLSDPIDQMIALLHDVLEDTEITVNVLYTLDVPREVIDTVIELTRSKERYFDYIDRIKSPRGIKVKLADIVDNCNRLHTLLNVIEKASMHNRYIKAYNILINKLYELSTDINST